MKKPTTKKAIIKVVILRPNNRQKKLIESVQKITGKPFYSSSIYQALDNYLQLLEHHNSIVKKLSDLEIRHSKAMSIVEAHNTFIRLANQFKN